MSRTLSNAPGSDSPLKPLARKAPFSNAKLTRPEDRRELRRDEKNVSLVVEPNKFLELFVPERNAPPRAKADPAPSNPFHNMANPKSEKQMYKKYPKLLNKIIHDSTYTFVATPYKADRATDSQLVVDCGMYPKGMQKEDQKDFQRVCWSGIELPVECKFNDDPFEDSNDSGRPFGDKRKDAYGQALSYIELTKRHQHRMFVFMLIFVGIHCRLLRADRSGLFVTKRFNVTTENYLVQFLRRYTKLSREEQGYDKTAEYIDPSADNPLAKMMKDRLAEVGKAAEEEEHVIELWKVALDEKWPWWKLHVPDEVRGLDRCFLVGKPSFQAPGIRGRGTRGYIAVELLKRDNKEVLDTKFVHLKDCWRVFVDNPADQTMDIRKEGDTLMNLNNAHVELVPTLVAHGDIKGQNTRATLKAWKAVNGHFKCPLKMHQHYRLVVKEIGKPLSEFADSRELVSALFDCIKTHRDALNHSKIIHRDISGGNILLYKKKGDTKWHGLLTDWEMSKGRDEVAKPRQHWRTGTLQFSAVRVLDNPSKPITIADELECFFHVLIYYAIRFLKHNIPDERVGDFLVLYFDTVRGPTQDGQLIASEFKRFSMRGRMIQLKPVGIQDCLKFIDANAEAQGEDVFQNAALDPRHPLDILIQISLSWFSALYTLGDPAPAMSSDPGGASIDAELAEFVAEIPDQTKLEELANKLEDHSNILALIEKLLERKWPAEDKGKDKRPQKGYTPRSPETPQFSEIDSDLDEEDGDQLEDEGAAVPDAPAPNHFVDMAIPDHGRDERCPAPVVEGARADQQDTLSSSMLAKRDRGDSMGQGGQGATGKRTRC